MLASATVIQDTLDTRRVVPLATIDDLCGNRKMSVQPLPVSPPSVSCSLGCLQTAPSTGSARCLAAVSPPHPRPRPRLPLPPSAMGEKDDSDIIEHHVEEEMEKKGPRSHAASSSFLGSVSPSDREGPSSTQSSHRLLAYSDALISIIATVMVRHRGPLGARTIPAPTRSDRRRGGGCAHCTYPSYSLICLQRRK